MSETPEQLEAIACVIDAGDVSLVREAWLAQALRQAAQDARVIEQVRAWAKGADLPPEHNYYSPEMTMRRRVLAELDRLAPPQKQE